INMFFAAALCVQNVDTGCLLLPIFPTVTSEHSTETLDALPYRTRRRNNDSNVNRRYIEPFDQRSSGNDDLSRATPEQVESRLASRAGRLAIFGYDRQPKFTKS